MRRKRVSQATSAASSSKRSSAAGSRSMQTSVPAGAEPVGHQARVAARAEGAVHGGLAAARALSGRSARPPARVRASRVMSRRIAKALRHLLDVRVELPAARAPSGARPRPRGGPPRPPRPRPSRSPRARAAGRRSVTRPAASSSISKELPWKKRAQLAVLGAHRVQAGEGALDDLLVGLGRPDGHAGLRVLGENDVRRRTRRGTGPGCSAGSSRPASARSGPGMPSRPQRKSSDRSGGVGGAPPLRSVAGRHRTPLSPTLQHTFPPLPSDAAVGVGAAAADSAL